MNGRERILSLLNGGNPDRLPVMPITMQYAADQIGVPYGKYATDWKTLCDAQIATAEKFHFDYVSVISDPAVEAYDCGATVLFPDDAPPAIDETKALLTDKSRLSSLELPVNGKRMANRIQAVGELKRRAGSELLIEGWIEGPCAEASDLRGINHLMLDFMDDPVFVEELFAFILRMELAFATEQIAAGADIIGIGDAAASLVGPRIYDQFVQPIEKQMAYGIHAMGAKVRLHICGNTRRILKGMGQVGADIVDLDYPSPIADGRLAMGPDQALLGNMNPVQVLRDQSPNEIKEYLAECHRQAGDRYIVGAGCEIPRGTPEANVMALSEYSMG